MAQRTAKTCSVTGCDRPYRCTGFCRLHYGRWLTWGDPMANLPPMSQQAAGLTCCIDDCAKPVRCKSMCGTHYNRMRTTGRPDLPEPPPEKFCSVETCNRKSLAVGLCAAHHQRFRVYGDPMPEVPLRHVPNKAGRTDIESRILARCKTSDDGCILWTGPVDRGGYGGISWHGRGWRAHRAMWTFKVGPIPEGDWTLDHLCYNRNCVNVDHLEVVTRGENTMRAMLRKYAGSETLPTAVLEFLRAARESGVTSHFIDSLSA